MAIEKLSDDEREHIVRLYDSDEAEAKALRIIDQLAEALVVAEREVNDADASRERLHAQLDYEVPRRKKAESEVARLTEALAAAERREKAANALLARVRASSRGRRWAKDIDAHLSAQPAAPARRSARP